MMSILQDDLGMLLRGEVIWQKAKGAGGSCAWGSYRSPQNPVLRDTAGIRFELVGLRTTLGLTAEGRTDE